MENNSDSKSNIQPVASGLQSPAFERESMKVSGNLVALIAIVASLLGPQLMQAQVGTPTYAERYVGSLSPNRSAALFVTVTNSTDTAIIVEGVTMTDLIAPEQCPRYWFGDAGYSDRPRGENEQNPPVPAYDLPSAWLGTPITLQPGEATELPAMNLFMIEAAPNSCQRVNLSPVYEVAWSFQAPAITYGTVSGAITDANSTNVITDAVVTISGTTVDGVVSEQVSVDANGIYTSANQYQSGTAITVGVSAPGYQDNAVNGTVTEGANFLNVALDPVPVPTASVSGSITDAATGSPVAAASVIISGTDVDGESITETLTTNPDGTYTTTLLFAATTPITVSVQLPGYDPIEFILESPVEGTNVVDLAITAEVAAPSPTPSPPAESTPTPSPIASPTTPVDPTATVEPTQPTVVPTETATPETTSTATTEPTIMPTETPESPVQPTVVPEAPVTGLPSTGSGPISGGPFLLTGAIAAASLCAAGIRRRQ